MKPNIIMIVADSLRHDYVDLKDGNSSLMPNLARLAQEAVVFDQAISQGPSTRVAMSAMMSSTYPSLYGGQKSLSSDRPVIQAMLKNADYTTAGVTSNLYLSESYGWSRGFDHYDDCRPEQVYSRKFWMRAANQAAKRIGRPLGWPKSLPAQYVFENAEIILRDIETPFFMWVHLMDTHWPYAVQKFSWSAEWIRKTKENKAIKPRLVASPPQITQEEHDQLTEEYKESISYTDKYIGVFMTKLKKRGLLANSWLIITADHGEEFNEHGLYFHHPYPYDNLVHVPLIIKPPESFPHQDLGWYDGQVRLIDLVPTFLDIANIEPPTNTRLLGSSLLPLLNGERSGEDRPALIESPGNEVLSLRQNGWKYIWHVDSDERLLFNLAEDVAEQRNVIHSDPELAQELHVSLEQHLAMVSKASVVQGTLKHEVEIDTEVTRRLRELGYVD